MLQLHYSQKGQFDCNKLFDIDALINMDAINLRETIINYLIILHNSDETKIRTDIK